MKVLEMIQKLCRMNPDADVVLHSSFGDSALAVLFNEENPEIVWIESKDDSNIRMIMNGRFFNIPTNKFEKIEFYKNLINTGYTLSMVREHIGFEEANEMELFCEENGIDISEEETE